jgi:glycosyltransferase involved in cell wall biosynthesis
VAVSQTVADRLRAGIVTDLSHLVVIENGVDTAVFAPAPDNGRIRQELRLPAEVPIIGSVGRLEHIKGYDVTIEAYARLVQEWPGGSVPALVIGGDGSEREYCAALARNHGLDRVHLLGWRDDIHDLHAAFTLFTMSSRSEGTSVSLLEAMSAGLCPVVTDVGGNAAVLGERLEHRLVPKENPAALARAWRETLLNSAGRQRDAMWARGRVQERFSLAHMVRKYEELYAGG